MVFKIKGWGQAQTEPVEMDKAFEIQRIYVKTGLRWLNGKETSYILCLPRAEGFAAWLGSGTQL